MQGLKTFFCRKNLGFMLLAAVQLAVLLARFGADFGAGSPIEVTPDLLHPYAGQAVREEQGVRVEDFVGQFAVSNDLNIEAGSYRVLVSYANDGGIIPDATIDLPLPAVVGDRADEWVCWVANDLASDGALSAAVAKAAEKAAAKSAAKAAKKSKRNQ